MQTNGAGYQLYQFRLISLSTDGHDKSTALVGEQAFNQLTYLVNRVCDKASLVQVVSPEEQQF